MWSVAVAAIIWIAGLSLSRMTGNNTDPQKSGDGEIKSLKLDALKAIRESAYQRWEKRRNYEWQLSFSIWTALAAFSGIVIGKEFQIAERYWTALAVGVIGISMAVMHRYYILKMFEHTIADVHIQRWAEKEIYKLAFTADMPVGDPKFPNDVFHPPLSKYGRVQAFITLVLALAAVGAVLAPRNQPAQSVVQTPSISIPANTKK